nr:MAG TPA: Thioredoxin signature protein-LIKE DOMAIN, ALPHA-BETA PROTEIN, OXIDOREDUCTASE.62A [Caudoviricetes sp.]
MKMKKIIICILSIFLIIICIVVYGVYQKNENTAQIGVDNKTYESYENKEVLGTDIISIINKATDSNKKNDIKIGEDGNYIDNGKNSIRIEIKFLELDKVITMERINNVGIEKFWSNYGALSFKCTKIEYHEKTHRVKYMYFEEV